VPLRPWIGQEPIQVRSDVPKDSYEQKRISLLTGTWALNVVQYMTPPLGYYWVVDSMLIETDTSADVGTRDTYVYVRTAGNKTMRFRSKRTVASEQRWQLFTYGAGWANDGASSGFLSFPLPLTVMDDDTSIGVMIGSFISATDVINVHLMVKEYKVV